tara:strand:+ start:806 stop:913 length:108 start_codon:yes stop_codon:yes gene_type:complete
MFLRALADWQTIKRKRLLDMRGQILGYELSWAGNA